MNRAQVIILWIGLALTLVYLFSNKTIHDALFTTNSQAGTVSDANFASNSPVPGSAVAGSGVTLD